MHALSLKFAIIGALWATPVTDQLLTIDEFANGTLTVEQAVKACVDAVRATKVGQFDQMFFNEFDAYYNPATSLVESNAYRNGDRLPLYTFNKCMVQKGHPLVRPKAN